MIPIYSPLENTGKWFSYGLCSQLSLTDPRTVRWVCELMEPGMPNSAQTRMAHIQPPIIPLINELIDQNPGTISLGQGVVHFGPPPDVLNTVKGFWKDPANHQYGPIEGNERLRQQIRDKLRLENRLQTDDLAIVVTAGSNMAFFNAILGITKPGDEIIIPSPFYFNQEMAVLTAGCRPVTVPVDQSYLPDPGLIEDAISPRTRAIVTISPNNPTGVVYPDTLLDDLNEICSRHGIYHISDEAYEYFVYGSSQHYSPGSRTQSGGHTISLYSLSKAYGFAGWRIGYMAFPIQLLESLKKIQDTNVICPAIISQHAALAALMSGRSYCQPYVEEMAAVRLSVLKALSVLGDQIRVVEPTGAFYVFIEVPNTTLSDMMLTQRLIEDYQVAVVPGRAFGISDRCSLRVSYGALRTKDVLNGMGRLVDGLGQLI